MTLSELRAERTAVSAEIDEILAKDELGDEDRTRCDELESRFVALGVEIDDAENRSQADGDRRTRNQERQKALQASAGRRTSQSRPATIGNAKPAWEDDPKCGFKDHREYLMGVMTAGRHGYTDDARLKFLSAEKMATAGSDEQGTYADPYGGFFVPVGLAPGVMSVPAEVDPIGPLTTKIPMTTPTVNINARTDKNHTSSVSGGLTVARRAETQTPTSSRITFEQVELKATALFGLAYASEEVLERSPVSFLALLEAGFRDEFGAKLLDERLNGTGVGQFEGVINAPATISQAKETGQAATTLVYENIIKMRARCWGYGSAVWLANHDTLPQLMIMNQSVGTGGVVVWQPSAREDHPDMLLGRPIYFSEFTKTLGTKGDVVLGNWSQYLEGTLSGSRSAESMHVRFLEHERTFKFWVENDARCWWRAALTPKQSTTTLSPFVVLDTRA
jgi:HK97 family phage major capsid protein